MVTDTGTTVRQLRSGVWTDVPVMIRDGHYCLCGDLHGKFKVCVGGSAAPGHVRQPARRRQVVTTQGRDAQTFFPLADRRLPRAIPQTVIDACADCGPYHDAHYYCPDHRTQAIRNVILAGRKSAGVISLHMLMAEQGYDIVS